MLNSHNFILYYSFLLLFILYTIYILLKIHEKNNCLNNFICIIFKFYLENRLMESFPAIFVFRAR